MSRRFHSIRARWRSHGLGLFVPSVMLGLCSCASEEWRDQPPELEHFCADSWVEFYEGFESSFTVLCGVETQTPMGCADTRVVRVPTVFASRFMNDFSCELRNGYAPLYARHHPIVDECLSPEEAGELFGVNLCLREEE